MPDFFVSYTSADRDWAEWIAYVLEEDGFQVVIQAWDFRPGANFVLEMQKAASEAERTIMVLSSDYLQSQFASPEWAAAFAQDPQGLARKLVPIMVRPCNPPGLLAPIVHINLSDADEDTARRLLLDGVNAKRSKPSRRPSFPGTAAKRAHKSFPGPSSSSAAYLPKLKRSATDADKRRFSRESFNVISAHFESGLDQLSHQNDEVECSFEPNTATDFTAEVFVTGKSVSRCRVWLGAMLSRDNIGYAEGQFHRGNDACNEILSVEQDDGDLYLSAMMAMGFGQAERLFDVKHMSQEQAADYLWRRFLAPLER
jgi:TIR domain